MKKILSLAMVLILGIVLLPTLVSADEFSYSGPPAFTITYPEGSSPDEKTDPAQVLRIQWPVGLYVDVAVAPIPEGLALKDYAEKAYLPALAKGVNAQVKLAENKEITLSDGTKAYYAEMTWTHAPTGTPITSLLVAAYKDGKLVVVDAHPYQDFDKFEKIVKSLKFK